MQIESEDIRTVDWRDAGIDPPHADVHGGIGAHGRWILDASKFETVSHVFLKLVEAGFPRGRYRARFDVQRRDVPAQRFIEDVVDVPALAFPVSGNSTGFHGDGAVTPDVADAGAHDLLRIEIEHLGPFGTQIAETVETPTRAVKGAISKGIGLVEIHQQLRGGERGEPDVDQLFLDLKCRHVIAPALAPIADG